jgi:putative transposase
MQTKPRRGDIIMPGTFSQIYIQVVFAVKRRENLLQKPWRDEVFKYMSGIIKEKNQKPIIVNGVTDHVHLFIGLKPVISLSDLVRDVKNNTTNFVNDRKFLNTKFSWQEGYGAFSYSHSQLDTVYQYILNQEEHHKKKTFKAEYLDLLEKFEIEYDEKYLFDWIE